MPGFYNFTVNAPRLVPIKEQLLLLDTGRNTFNVLLHDLNAFLQKLADEGCTVERMIRLDEPATEDRGMTALLGVGQDP